MQMKSLSLAFSYSPVKRLVYTLAFALLALVVLTTQARAADTPAPAPAAPTPFYTSLNCAEDEKVKVDETTGRQSCVTDDKYLIRECKEKEDALWVEKKLMTSTCQKAGISASGCIEKVKKCVEEEVTDDLDPNILEQALPLLNQVLGSGIALPGSEASKAGCSNRSESDFKDEKERLDRELKESETDLADIATEMSDAKAEQDKEMKETQQDIAEAKKEMEEVHVELDKESRDIVRNGMEEEQKAAESVRNLTSQILSLRGSVALKESEFAAELRKLVSPETTCLLAAHNLRKAIDEAGLYKNGNFVAQGNERKKALEAEYNRCFEDIKAQRKDIMTRRSNYLRSTQNQLSGMEESLEGAQKSIQTYSSQVQTTAKEIEKQKTQAQTRVVEKMQNSSYALQAVATRTQEKVQALSQKQVAAQARLATLSADIGKMGPTPKKGQTEGWRAAQSAVIDYQFAKHNFCGGECGKISKSACSAKDIKDAEKALKKGASGDTDDGTK
jgi:hypothetical protein